MSHTPRPQSRQRDPPPALFLHPSPSASNVSLPNAPAPSVPFLGQSTLAPGGRSNADRAPSVRSGTVVTPSPQRPGLFPAESTRATGDRTDLLWSEMQATLEEVELSASGGTHVFGPDHDRKLADLRAAQIALAQAWARSEADDVIETAQHDHAGSVAGEEVRNLKGTLGDTSRTGPDGTDGAKSTVGSSSIPRPNSSGTGVERLGAKLEEETEVDILLARKRREANDRYFQRVNQGVIDVVTRLEDVALAMRAVEQESKELTRIMACQPQRPIPACHVPGRDGLMKEAGSVRHSQITKVEQGKPKRVLDPRAIVAACLMEAHVSKSNKKLAQHLQATRLAGHLPVPAIARRATPPSVPPSRVPGHSSPDPLPVAFASLQAIKSQPSPSALTQRASNPALHPASPKQPHLRRDDHRYYQPRFQHDIDTSVAMRLLPFIATALAVVPSALAVDQKKSAIVWFEDDSTPDSVVNEAKNALIEAGGKITHVYSIIKGFSVIAPEKALELVQTSHTEHQIHVEEDEVVSTT
ncbi:hypothetical protein FALBO_8356 [Fusarium albosuccineum]|uniref:Inhibitor I9 domain-containing protein n=1 Tax=Fusarium albosuccineum TaxID=1237068 RepID=A0A8H4L9N8_9HYPO|nr:hypothetical protein FALBO_8356 [Fusarium albosuccineum]